VGAVFANHNRSPRVRAALEQCLEGLESGGIGLNVGAGSTDLHQRIINLDIKHSPTVHCLGLAGNLPFAADSVAVIVSQETLEHVRDPFGAAREMYRVLQVGGTLYCQLPFIIGYHPGPTDFWRFSREGIRALVERSGFVCEEVGIAVGPATGFYRIAVEFIAVLSARLLPKLYHPVKGAAALLLYPVKLLDSVMLTEQQAHRIPGGYYVIARRP